ncbi:alpha/beta hydrolase family protein [Actinokineospora sp. HUAS TT18]|uniref:alpha/beta hydrolase family protein n=1 Tax=Actinokineospora sp. HUAS TT18 TaxID=3447451 RepID=UPI003F522B6C
MPIVVTGLTLTPPGKPPAGGWPVIAWGHGTTGIGDDCAPSAVPGAGAYYDKTLNRFLRAGYAVAATDYPGLGSPGTHPYLVAESEARAVIDSVRAARRVTPGLSRVWLAAGHSQGGQAAMATAEIADEYGAGLRFEGAVVYAPAPNMSGNLPDEPVELHPLEQTFYSMMLVGLKTQHPELNYGDYLGTRAQALLPAVRTLCFDDLAARFEAAALPGSEFAPSSPAATQQLREWFTTNEIGRQRADGPVLVVQGADDPVVLPTETEKMVTSSREHGSNVDYNLYPDADHGGVLDASAPDVLTWLANHTPT